MYCRFGAFGIEVASDATSKETITSSSWMEVFLSFNKRCFADVTVIGECRVRGALEQNSDSFIQKIVKNRFDMKMVCSNKLKPQYESNHKIPVFCFFFRLV